MADTENTNVWTEIYDVKHDRVGNRPQGKDWLCPKCDEYRGHKVDCEFVEIEAIANLLAVSRGAEVRARKLAAKYLSDLQRMHGKLALLKHENNKLRKANEKLRRNDPRVAVSQDDYQKLLRQLGSVEAAEKHIAARLRELADIVESPSYPVVEGWTDEGQPAPVGSVTLTLSVPWGG